ncbi:hypothetical protein BW723_00990 [Polaribacter reichenbachii]|uniref:Uncharacterized protein n=1 Tax=Polaribacter reichenbachii TaxID=996801 RepID=A0A1B8TS14_9FLAO|nr:hypothetical protein [Polaribacter reichenbachii]APZ44947.1 hypothetical protein BW723_00990 [Polaribacter reichenbachii]AUC18810.1 hypothetical protein BTO17_08995 [Polaribacter reichenbachii]OBY62359.1 hypothetical protein LPB301_14700 [Polaribacter reichenbachii]
MKSVYTNTVERGILTSAYKREIKQSISESKRATLSNMKSMIETHQDHVQSQTGTILRVALFFGSIIMIIS